MPEGRIDVMGVSDAEAPPRLPELGAVGALRWVWRQLTSMRVALMLLMLLAVVALPGSVRWLRVGLVLGGVPAAVRRPDRLHRAGGRDAADQGVDQQQVHRREPD